MKILIFGGNCQDGFYLEQICRARGMDVISISRSGSQSQGNVSDYNLVERLVVAHKPNYIFHLAANSTTQHDAMFENHETISTGTLNVLEAVKRHCPGSRVFITGSGLQFKNTGAPIFENDEFEASSPYCVARIQSVYAARYYRSLGIRAYVGYLFHHESPYRKPNHISMLIALAVQRIVAGSEEIIELGDISVAKEWTFAGDVAEAIIMLMEQDHFFEAVIGSGKAYTIKDWLECCFELVGKDWRNHVKLKDEFRADYPILLSNPVTIKSIGWQTKTDFRELAGMMLGLKQ